MTETRWGECRICKQVRMLQSVIGQHTGEFWAGWVCQDCLNKLQEKDWRDDDGQES